MFKCCFSTSAEEPKKISSGPISVAVKVAEKPVMLKFRMSPDAEGNTDASKLEEQPQVKEKAVFSVLPASASASASASSTPAAAPSASAQTAGKSVLRAALVIGALYTYLYYTVASRV